MICLIFNLIFVLIQSMINFMMFKMMGFEYLQRLWSWVDIAIFVISITILIQFFLVFGKRGADNKFEDKLDNYMNNTIILRIMLMLGQFVLFSKS